MPDWSYQTLFRPLLFRLPPKLARDLTLHAMGALAKLPGGRLLIRTMGHMEPSPLLESELAGVPLPYPVGLSGGLDPRGVAHRALAQFGLGFIEIGPVTVRELKDSRTIRRDIPNEAIVYPDAAANPGLDATLRRLQRKRGHPLPLMLRIRSMPGSSPAQALQEERRLLAELRPYAAAFYIEAPDPGWPLQESLAHLQAIAASAERLPQDARQADAAPPLLLYAPPDYPQERLAQLLHGIRSAPGPWAGVVIGDAACGEGGAIVGRACRDAAAERVALLRELGGPEMKIVAGGGVHEPEDALELRRAGADFVQLHSGLVYAGPGLAKRINEAILYETLRASEAPAPPSFWHGWGWMCLLGLGMIVGGVLAWIIAATTVVLPYDTAFLGMEPAALTQANPYLLGFMSHDRVTLAGTMISIGIIYGQLAYHGLGKGLHWAKTALTTSCIVGFSSFFLYLGYGYFDPLHASAAAILLPMFILSMRRQEDLPPRERPNLLNDRIWRRAQWGQLMMVSLGLALAIGGLVISFVGVTAVFVPEDLQYLCATPEMLAAINDKLLPLIAHDRAGFGGALFADALALLAAALWGIRQGSRWLWWTFLLGGLPGFLAGFSVHQQIGYTNAWHLLPAYFAFALYVLGLLFLYPYMMSRQAGSPVDQRQPGPSAHIKRKSMT
ncbi:Dihydroorotate dehydrogenase (quinone) [Paenibacillus konkukensis]|uniref:Dihydroorotate dehydrogenase (Quinone) n=1 Tax=Paenibacillus konkukensis TaxID=2020716 RepID=A0ABY4RT46_9BACL|nr:hypothetical protein [Paenibacillus konkukensis]UQZ85761.1 Dihydroorotate dehydrogenase (quinone) [Paenibacillus konkukensis]